jgi:hypothetical protein
VGAPGIHLKIPQALHPDAIFRSNASAGSDAQTRCS